MAESNSQPTRCPCGFFGSAQTLGLCSKCYREREQNRDQMTADVSRSGVSIEMRMEREVAASFQEDSPCNNVIPRVGGESSEVHAREVTETPRVASSSAAADLNSSTSDTTGSNCFTHQRGTKRKLDETDEDETGNEAERLKATTTNPDGAEGGDQALPVQKSMKRCFHCNSRMSLAIREMGKCKCDYIFCSLHRLPEQHKCTFDHKEYSRQEARAKMVVLRKHVGTTLRRLDQDSS